MLFIARAYSLLQKLCATVATLTYPTHYGYNMVTTASIILLVTYQ